MCRSEYKKASIFEGAVWEEIGKELGKSKDRSLCFGRIFASTKERKRTRRRVEVRQCSRQKWVHYDRMNYLDTSLDVRESHSRP
uniref:Uncharacterized protein n=1 Tax=Ditylenchus dipsaci TaxID=166011 RepID=A0A915EPM6_9BILA